MRSQRKDPVILAVKKHSGQIAGAVAVEVVPEDGCLLHAGSIEHRSRVAGMMEDEISGDVAAFELGSDRIMKPMPQVIIQVSRKIRCRDLSKCVRRPKGGT